MQKIIVSPNEAGQRLDKLLAKHLSEAPKSFFYKMLRKKNIKLNGARAQGNEKLKAGDEITLFLAEETIQKFSGKKETIQNEFLRLKEQKTPFQVLYEDSEVLLVGKPSGMLSQKAKPQDISLNEYVIAYMLKSGSLSLEELKSFKPGICNRLDRNTSGLVAAGKTLRALQQLGEMFRLRTMKKYYLTIVNGELTKETHIHGWLVKDEQVQALGIPHSLYMLLLYGRLIFFFMVGAWMCRHAGSFTRVSLGRWWLWGALLLAVVVQCLVRREMMYVWYTPLVAILLSHAPLAPVVQRVLTVLGRYSMPMWLVHTWFAYYLFKDYVYALRYPVLIFLALTLVSLATSWLVMQAVRPLLRRL